MLGDGGVDQLPERVAVDPAQAPGPSSSTTGRAPSAMAWGVGGSALEHGVGFVAVEPDGCRALNAPEAGAVAGVPADSIAAVCGANTTPATSPGPPPARADLTRAAPGTGEVATG